MTQKEIHFENCASGHNFDRTCDCKRYFSYDKHPNRPSNITRFIGISKAAENSKSRRWPWQRGQENWQNLFNSDWKALNPTNMEHVLRKVWEDCWNFEIGENLSWEINQTLKL